MVYVICFILIVLLVGLCIYLNRKINLKYRNVSIEKMKSTFQDLQNNKYADKPSNISEWSYQRFCNFFDTAQEKDPNFEEKIAKIYYLIVDVGLTDLDEIAKETDCDYDELLLKIKYLKNKRKLEYLYIDRHEGVIRKCNLKDKKLLEKYEPYIYDKHLQPREIAELLPMATSDNIDKLTWMVINEISYLDDKYLISGLNVDKVDGKIIYYTVEKHKKEKNYVSINCPKCGALNDVPRYGKARCLYCKGIVEDKQ